MLREIHLETLPWESKTCTSLRDLVVDEAERQLERIPTVDLFDNPTESDAAALYRFSYAAMEAGPGAPVPSAEELRRSILVSLQDEFRSISQDEYELLAQLAASNGVVPLVNRDCYPTALSLVQRMWCVPGRDKEGFMLMLPETLVRLMELTLTMPGFPASRAHVMGMEQALDAALYMNGVLDADLAMHLVLPAIIRGMPVPSRLIRRFMIAAFDCCREPSGKLWLLHPGAVNCTEMIRGTREGEVSYALPDPLLLLSLCSDGVLPSEKRESDLLTASLNGAVRPEYTGPMVCEDVRVLLKQNVPMDDVMRALASRLSVRPTRRMADCVRQLRRVTCLWGQNKTTAVMQ